MVSRLEVTDRNALEAGRILAQKAQRLLGTAVPGLENIFAIITTELYLVDRSVNENEQQALFTAIVDGATQEGIWTTPTQPSANRAEIALRPGVTDPIGEAFARAAAVVGLPALQARSGSQFTFFAEPGSSVSADTVKSVTEALLRNDIVDEVAYGDAITPRFADGATNDFVEIVEVRGLSDFDLAMLNKQRGLSLDPEELVAVRDFFERLNRDPTDAEVETIAQTWSEHCSHKTFRAHITWSDGEVVEPLLKQLRRSTDTINAPFVKSAFVDNAGIIAFDETFDVAIKVETHNHPSAVEPFGGANTGVGGVIRDVLGVAADPIAVTDILCFGPLDTPFSDLPAGVLHPERIRDGVVSGIADYGNKLGLPTVAGAIVHHEGFTANPLVFCGCIGLRPAGLQLTGQQPGDRIIVIGGATGRDGIRGATFSSTTMDATTGDVAGASVQIGDPIIEKLVADVLTEARSANLFTAITDCGAGGFSSSVGELAAELGADVDLDSAPRKYPGLAPWEVWLSEAQERMVLAVQADNVGVLSAICDSYGVLITDLGCFRSDGQLVVRCAGQLIVDLPGHFLHDGRPQRRMTAAHPPVPPAAGERPTDLDGNATDLLLKILAHSDVRSNEDVVRGYDHEILGATIGRPFLGASNDGPANAAVLAPLRAASGRGLAIGIGMNCRTGEVDSKAMAEAAVDEAIRNIVAVGADPDQVALLDNFSWGDPRRPEMLGRLVDAVAGCCDAAAAHNAPFVSGKDSLNNEYATSSGERRSIPPTLVITALGVVPEATKLVTSDAKCTDHLLVMVGELFPTSRTGNGLRGSVLDSVLGVDGPGDVAKGDPGAPARYRAVHELMKAGLVAAAHDVSDGGLAVTVAEMAMGGRCGVTIELENAPSNTSATSATSDISIVAALFGEWSGRIVLEVAPEEAETVCARTGGTRIGVVTANNKLVVSVAGREVISANLDGLLQAWRGHVPNQSTTGAAS